MKNKLLTAVFTALIISGLVLSCDPNPNIGASGAALGTVDIDGDGVSDGTAIDVDGDGTSDGIDTDGDGAIDEEWSDDWELFNGDDQGSGAEESPADTTAPSAVSGLKIASIGYGDTEYGDDNRVILTWSDPADSDLEKINISYDGVTEPVSAGEETVIITSLNELERSEITVTAVDKSGNASPGKSVDVFMFSSYRSAMTPVYITSSSGSELNSTLADNESGYFILETDIDLNGVSWTPARLKGVFDGNGHTISNLNKVAAVTNMGFISFIDNEAAVMNLYLDNFSINSTSTNPGVYRVGSIVGYNSGAVYNCGASGSIDVKFPSVCVGGLTAWSDSDGLIENSFTDVSVNSANDCTGGFIGCNQGYIKNCYATGNVTTSDIEAGGFVGLLGYENNSSNAKILYCYSAGAVSTTSTETEKYAAGFCGRKGSGTTFSYNYYNSTASGLSDSHAKDVDLTNKDSFTDFDFTSVWSIDSSVNGGMPYLTDNQPK